MQVYCELTLVKSLNCILEFFREIKFNANFVTQSYDFFCQTKLKAIFTEFQEFFREINFKVSFVTQFHDFFVKSN